ncbi:cation-translocating P-type ATPase [Herbaspirillum seropedicae]|uniref:P-type Cu(+) transporter n=1 Tax=Herbaspirillum seropedicae (strain SmR1) TaxID=757424 RepID=D8IVD6_HERSS|nr:cation-translocating P-type ATPase [Herbaspirillum seropedicae]ADJ63875.1 cation transport ATPase protein [Herbaspirillum seropedicae SmR1]AKN65867.1 ATPase [Herbaspirillum seropedicae]NQE29018.1 ATPase [Herbaspirillum seropedicae]UMU21845.1 cation-translocating P-type ATPase [Herbaspirillum seropedicae]
MMQDSNDDHHGLSHSEVTRLLAEDGPNVLHSDQRRMGRVLMKVIREPMFMLLLSAAAIYLTLGELREGLLLLFMVALTVGLTLYQGGKTERALAALRVLNSPTARVIRDGRTMRIAAAELVRGDLILLEEGARVPADAGVLEASNLQLDESLLTGEACPVEKFAPSTKPEPHALPSGQTDSATLVRSGTLVVRGSGIAKVTATGARTELGKISSLLHELVEEPSPMQRHIARIVTVLAVTGLMLSALLVVLEGYSHGRWTEALLMGIALSMSLLPEELPIILTIFPAIGAWRMARANVLTRRLSAIETLGSISVLCTDKTGTLTENRMRVVQGMIAGRHMYFDESDIGITSPEWRTLLETAALASSPRPTDPMEKAFHQLAGESAKRFAPPALTQLLQEYPFTPALRAMTMVWKGDDDAPLLVATKGAPEAIASLCGLTPAEVQQMQNDIMHLGSHGLRVIAVAACNWSGALPASQAQFGLRYLGLLALADPLRPGVPDAIQRCHQAEIRVIMITGDHPSTAQNIARQAGISADQVLLGDEVQAMAEHELARRLRTTNVCARITPLQKLRIVAALKDDGEIIAMTGDGVNDAPALKAAHVGIAMGARGTDVAREAGSLILLDDNFASIVEGILMGRRIFSRMRGAMIYVLAMHMPIAGMALLPVVFGWPLILYPMQIAFLELIVDPACTLAFENTGSDYRERQAPRRHGAAPLLDARIIILVLVQGSVALLFAVSAYLWFLERLTHSQARAAEFIVLVLVNLGMMFSALVPDRYFFRAFCPGNYAALIISIIAVIMLLATVYLPALANTFHFSPPPALDLAMAFAWGALALLAYECAKLLINRMQTPSAATKV